MAALRPLGVHHVALLVNDLEAAERFYGDVVGLPLERRWPAPEGGTRSVWLKMAHDALLMLERAPTQTASRAAASGLGWQMLALRITSLERTALIERLQRHGVVVTRQTDYSFYVEDPEGNRLGFSHWPVAITRLS